MKNVIAINDLVEEISRVRPPVIAIDGFLGAGKSTLAKILSEAFNYTVVGLDEFLRSTSQGSFLSRIDFDRLRNVPLQGYMIFEGVHVLDVLSELGVSFDQIIFVTGARPTNLELSPEVAQGVRKYLDETYRVIEPDFVVDMNFERENWRTQVDIAYIKSKTTLAVVLAIGGMLTICVGLVVFVIGAKADDTALLKLAGIEISAKGLGAVILATSSVWAYLAFLSRPKYAHSREKQVSSWPDGSSRIFETQSSTMIDVDPRSGRQGKS